MELKAESSSPAGVKPSGIAQLLERRANLFLGVALFIVLAAASLQGQQIAHVRQMEIFYRWVVSVPNQARLFDELTEKKPYTGPKNIGELNPADDARTEFEKLQNIQKAPAIGGEDVELTFERDKEVYDELVAASEQLLPDVPVEESATISNSDPRLVRVVFKGGLEDELWDLSCNPELEGVRKKFFDYRRKNQLATLGTQFGLSDMYDQGTLVSLTNMFFGFRKMAANLVWLQVDKYFHSGSIHRMIPLMNTTVALDPNFVDAYLLGAWHLAYNVTAEMTGAPERMKTYNFRHDVWVDEREGYFYNAVDFLKDGVRKNPSNYKLYFDLGYTVYEEKLRDHKNAVRYLTEATHHKHDTWVRSTLYRCLQYNEEYEKAIDGWKDYIKTFPDSPRSKVVAPRFIDLNTGLIFERDGEAALERAHSAEAAAKELRAQAAAATDPAESTRLETEAQTKDAESLAERQTHLEQLEAAREVWIRLQEVAKGGEGQTREEFIGEKNDTFADARIKRMDAIILVEEGRYHEALGLLETARFENTLFFEEASQMIINIKKQFGLPLYLTEQMAEERRKDYIELKREREKLLQDLGIKPAAQ
jgi:hypothetical protein